MSRDRARDPLRRARVLIFDEPTAALGVKQSFNVLKLIHKAAKKASR